MTDAARAKADVESDPAKYIEPMLAKMSAHDKAAFNFCMSVRWPGYAAEQTTALRAALSESVRIFEEAYGDDSDAALVPSVREAEWYRKSRSLLAVELAGEEPRG